MRHTLKKQALLTFFIFFLLLPIFPESSPNQTVQIGALKVRPGEVKSGFLQVPEKNGIKTKIPITVINGKQQGKTLALIAGVHGYEYPPILALYRLKKRGTKALSRSKRSGDCACANCSVIHHYNSSCRYPSVCWYGRRV